ncbi:transcriptional regulator, GntR family [Rubrobacter xylanophilus DSM 9941]|uniref:Transcriptional regulator, GntR family n=1 Tax=Rubrobacter xylanophilus (strain DSM 9941 / JCM 11954 / NBRC 16129 / PRD-1) TaxID=266117 RepID=Q1ASX2_RUBXD|nr:FadR/GntR family transcriptional regulator [Rubrobacter xylanophilus]ABG05506.1 transcriptional regulator, GntR family [Rubrobacter xylanophilus DSM 9941]
MFRPVSDRRALGERVISQIADAVIRGELRPGQRLPTERELAEQFGVSRTVVRDAIKTLSGRGMLRVRQGSGIFVSTSEERLEQELALLPLEGAGLRDLFEVRKVLEAQAAEWAAQRRSSHHVERLAQILREARGHREDPAALSERDARFHVAVAESSQNLVLVRVMLTLLDLLAASRLRSLGIPGRPQLSLEQHERVLEAIERRDPQGARRAMLFHLASVEAAIFSREGGEEG